MGESSFDLRRKLLREALRHVESDGWTSDCFRKAVRDARLDPELAGSLCPRGAVDLAVEFHRSGDDRMTEMLSDSDLSGLRFRDRVARAVWFRLEADAEHKGVARKCASLFASPMHATDGARLAWGTADRIWTVLGDPSEDLNWYTKRATLSAVLGSSVLFWLGDTSAGHESTQQFIDRRIENVMQLEKFKSSMRKNPAASPFMSAWSRFEACVKPPPDRRDTHPGSMPNAESGS